MKTLATLLLIFFAFVCKGQGTKDSLIVDSHQVQTIHCDTLTTWVRDTTWIKAEPPSVVKGLYFTTSQCAVGDPLSEGTFLMKCKRDGVNELNGYLRAYTYSSTKRSQLAAFVKKAKEQFGIVAVSIDVRMTDNRELPGITAYFQTYKGTVSMIALVAEFEPYVLNSDGKYDDKYLPTYESKYTHFFAMLPILYKLCHQYGTWFGWYEGWIGNNYSNPQAANDSLVKYTDRIYLSNYLPQGQYLASGGAWDNRMDKRTVLLAIGGKHNGKVVLIVEIISDELIKWGAGNDFLGNVFACPKTTTQLCQPFYDLTRTNKDYSTGPYSIPTIQVTDATDLIGRTHFYAKYTVQAQP